MLCKLIGMKKSLINVVFAASLSQKFTGRSGGWPHTSGAQARGGGQGVVLSINIAIIERNPVDICEEWV